MLPQTWPRRRQALGRTGIPQPDFSPAPFASWLLALLLAAGLSACRRDPPQVIVQTAPLPSQPGERTSYANAISNIAPSVVSVYTHLKLSGKSSSNLAEDPALRHFFDQKSRKSPKPTPREVEGLGSGVVITTNGFILTNEHVVKGADQIIVTTASGQEFKAKVVGTDPATDIAVLKAEAAGHLPAAILADSSQVRVGDIVLAIGNPFGVGQTVTSGIVSATERSGLGIAQLEDFIQTDAPINPGNSGGALVDAHGRVIGINTVILSSGGGFEGIGFAVPITLARQVMEQLIAHGRVVRGFLGVALHPPTAELAKAFHLPAGQGALVVQVVPKSPADRAGLREGDIITGLNGKAVTDSRELRLRIAQTPPGSEITLRVSRIGGSKALAAKLGELPSQPAKPASVIPGT